MKIKILFARLCFGGSHRQEIGNLLLEVALQSSKDKRIEDVIHCPISRFPTSVARNVLVQTARERDCDLLFMVDEDIWPAEGFYQTAVDFLLNQHGPAAIACPYVTGGGIREDVCVFEWAAGRTTGGGPAPNAPFALTNIVREDATRRTGIERVSNVGTGFICYKTSCFDRLPHPYFDYSYNDKTHTAVTETEDCWLHRRFWEYGVPLYVSWDHWCRHRKSIWCERPVRLTDQDVSGVFMTQARAELALGGKELTDLIPQDAPGWCDFAAVYERAVKQTPNGGRLVEVGSFQGQSAILMARLIKRSGKRLHFTCVDHFQGSQEHHEDLELDCTDLRGQFEANLERHGVAKDIQILPLASVEAAQTFADDSLDFVFLDASHDEDAVREDIAAWLPKIKTGGVLAGHDFEFFGVARAVTAMIPGTQVELIGRSWWYRKEKQDVKRNGIYPGPDALVNLKV